MSYTIKSDEDKSIIYLTLTDIITKDIALESRKELASFIEKTGMKKVLVDQSEAVTSVTPMGIYEFHSSHSGSLPSSIKLALVVSPEEKTFDNAVFAENVARNRGVNIRVFTDVDEGLKWLLS